MTTLDLVIFALACAAILGVAWRVMVAQHRAAWEATRYRMFQQEELTRKLREHLGSKAVADERIERIRQQYYADVAQPFGYGAQVAPSDARTLAMRRV